MELLRALAGDQTFLLQRASDSQRLIESRLQEHLRNSRTSPFSLRGGGSTHPLGGGMRSSSLVSLENSLLNVLNTTVEVLHPQSGGV